MGVAVVKVRAQSSVRAPGRQSEGTAGRGDVEGVSGTVGGGDDNHG